MFSFKRISVIALIFYYDICFETTEENLRGTKATKGRRARRFKIRRVRDSIRTENGCPINLDIALDIITARGLCFSPATAGKFYYVVNSRIYIFVKRTASFAASCGQP